MFRVRVVFVLVAGRISIALLYRGASMKRLTEGNYTGAFQLVVALPVNCEIQTMKLVFPLWKSLA